MRNCKIQLISLGLATVVLSGCASGRLGGNGMPVALTLEHALAAPTDANIINADNAYERYPAALTALKASIGGDTGGARSAAMTCSEEADKLPADVVGFCARMQELSYLQDYDLASWAQLQIYRRSRGGSTVFFSGF